jgi:hypothetical protein
VDGDATNPTRAAIKPESPARRPDDSVDIATHLIALLKLNRAAVSAANSIHVSAQAKPGQHASSDRWWIHE